MGSDDLFDGVESVETTGGLSEDDTVGGPTGLDPAGMVRRWLQDLTYKEVHAIVVGFAPYFLGLVLLALDVGGTLPNVLLTIGVLIGLASTLAAPAIRAGGRVTTAIRWMLQQPHYVLGGQVGAVLLGSTFLILARVAGTITGVML